jgi:DNA topoisomerase VI subunit B
MTTPSLQREVFATSRMLEYFAEDELEMQIGHERALWPLALSKELIDNAIDACESAGIAPEVRLSLRDETLTVEDNGPGLPAATVARSLDYAVRVSTNSRYVSPTRGQLGNALKTVWGAAFVANDQHGTVEIDTPGTRHLVAVRVDRLAQTPRIEHRQEESARRNGTLVRMRWPSLAS